MGNPRWRTATRRGPSPLRAATRLGLMDRDGVPTFGLHSLILRCVLLYLTVVCLRPYDEAVLWTSRFMVICVPGPDMLASRREHRGGAVIDGRMYSRELSL